MDVHPFSLANHLGVKIYLLKNVINGNDILKSIAQIIPSESRGLWSIEESIVTVHVSNLPCFHRLVEEGINIGSQHLCAFPLVAVYTAHNVFPGISNASLTKFFEQYGHVIEIQHVMAFPSLEKWKHMISDKRRIFFDIPEDEITVLVPKRIDATISDDKIGELWQSLKVKKFCMGCMEDGHHITHCLDLSGNTLNRELHEAAIDFFKLQITQNNSRTNLPISESSVSEKLAEDEKSREHNDFIQNSPEKQIGPEEMPQKMDYQEGSPANSIPDIVNSLSPCGANLTPDFLPRKEIPLLLPVIQNRPSVIVPMINATEAVAEKTNEQ